MVVFPAVVVGEHLVQRGVDLRVDVRVSLDSLFDFVENLEAIMVLTQIEPLFSLRDAAQVHGVLESLQARLGLLQEVD